jgi:2-oxoglutarate dehydrogenase E2 component (dihydrolipoamide succinyltransferase)
MTSSGTSSTTQAKRREGKIKIEDLSGGVFTISTGGIYGSLLSTPILNPPAERHSRDAQDQERRLRRKDRS